MNEVAGRIRDRALARPVAGIDVRVLQRGRCAASGRTDAEGRYRLSVPCSGVVRVQVLDADGAVLAASAGELDPGGDVRIDIAVPSSRLPIAGRRLSWVAGEPVDRSLADSFDDETLRHAYTHLRHPHLDVPDRERIRRAFPLAARDPEAEPDPRLGEWGECGEGFGDGIRSLLEERDASLGATTSDDLPAGAKRKSFRADQTLVHYTTDPEFPRDRVDPTLPERDEEILSSDQLIGWVRRRPEDFEPPGLEPVPSYVQRVGRIADWALARFTSAPFGLPGPGVGDGLLEVRVFDQSFLAGLTHPTWDFIALAPDLGGEVLLRIVPHLVFHRLQYAYNASTPLSGLRGVVREGTASWASRALGAVALPARGRGERTWIDGAAAPRRDAAGARDFWSYFAREFGMQGAPGPARGADVLRTVLETSAASSAGLVPAALREARARLPWWGRFDRFQRDPDGAVVGRETVFGNWQLARALVGFGLRSEEGRFRLDPRAVPPAPPEDELRLAAGDRAARQFDLTPYAARAFRVHGDAATTGMLRVSMRSFALAAGDATGLWQIARIDARGRLLDVVRLETRRRAKLVRVEAGGSLVVVVAARERALAGELRLEVAGGVGSVHTTPADARPGTDLELDPAGWWRTWVSPDVMVDNDDDGRADPVRPRDENRLKICLRNRGTAALQDVRVRVWCQPANLISDPDAWLPVADREGVVQERTGVRLDAGELRWVSMPWKPPVAVGPARGELDADTDWSLRVLVDRPAEEEDASTTTVRYHRIRAASSGKIIGIRVRPPQGGGQGNMVVVPHGPEVGLEPLDGNGAPPTGIARFRVTRGRNRRWSGARETRPRAGFYYPLDPSVLPAGYEAERLVSVVWMDGGRALGGTTVSLGSAAEVDSGDPSRRAGSTLLT